MTPFFITDAIIQAGERWLEVSGLDIDQNDLEREDAFAAESDLVEALRHLGAVVADVAEHAVRVTLVGALEPESGFARTYEGDGPPSEVEDPAPEGLRETPPVHRTITWHGEELRVKVERFTTSNHPALVLTDMEGDPAGTVNVNPPRGAVLPPGHILVRDYSEWQGITAVLHEAGIIGPPVGWMPSGFVGLPICPLLIPGAFGDEGVDRG